MKHVLREKTLALKARIVEAGLEIIGDGPVGPGSQLLLRMISRKALRPSSISTAAARSLPLRGPSSTTITPPVAVGASPSVRVGRFSALYAHLLQDVTVSPYASGVVTEDRLLLPKNLLRDRQRIRTDGAGLFRLGGRYCIGPIKQSERMPEAILVGGAGAFNWYHFMIECRT